MTEQVPKIKPLVWQRISQASFISECPVGYYEVYKSVVDQGRWKAKAGNHNTVTYASEAEAKAYCQDDYERRVRECLE